MLKQMKTWAVALPVGALGAVGAANAAMPEGVTEALADLQSNATTIAALVLVAIIAVFAIKFIRKGL